MRKIACLIFFGATLIAPVSYCQEEISITSGNSTVILSKDTSAVLSSFKSTVYSNKVYLKWTVKNQSEDGMYVIYRSADGVNFENIGTRHGIGVPISNDVAYYFIDKNPGPENNIYKLLFIAENKTYFMSNKISVRMDVLISAENAIGTK